MWANFWAAVSALSSTATLGVAVWAMFRWRKQEELKAKQDFKKAVGVLTDTLAQLPLIFKDDAHIREYSDRLDDLTSRFVSAAHAWHCTEGMLDKNKTINDSWEKVDDLIADYVAGKCERTPISEACGIILRAKFVFK